MALSVKAEARIIVALEQLALGEEGEDETMFHVRCTYIYVRMQY
jgi:hypothetical protein